MKSLVTDILNRIKKLWILLILLPLLTGVVSYYLEAKVPPSYTAEAKIELGNFENERLTDTKMVDELLESETFVEKVLDRANSDLDPAIVKERVKVAIHSGKVMKFTITGGNKEEVNTMLNDVVDGFLEISNELYGKKDNLLDKKIKATNELNSEIDGAQRQQILYDFEMTKINLRNTQLLDPIKVSESYSSPFKRAVFGILIGIMLNILIIFLPELFRSESTR